LGEGLLQDPAERAVVDGGKLALDRLDHLAYGVACGPAVYAGDRVLGQHRLAVVEFEARSQPEGPGQAIARHLFGLDHLTLRLKLGVDAIKGIPDQQAGVARNIRGCPNRIEIGKVSMRYQPHRPRRGALRNGRSSKPTSGGEGANTRGRLKEGSSV